MFVLEALPVLALPRRVFIDEPVTPQDLGDRRGCGNLRCAQIAQAPCDLAPAPAMLAAQLDNPCFDVLCRACGAVMWAAGAIGKPIDAFSLVAGVGVAGGRYRQPH